MWLLRKNSEIVGSKLITSFVRHPRGLTRLVLTLERLLVERAIAAWPDSYLTHSIIIRLWVTLALPHPKTFLKRRRIAAIRREWLLKRITHPAATRQMEKVLANLGVDHSNIESMLILRRLLGSSGLFSASAGLAQGYLKGPSLLSYQNSSGTEGTWLAQLAIGTGDKGAATEILEDQMGAKSMKVDPVIVRYLTLWREGIPALAQPAVVVGPSECNLDDLPPLFADAPLHQVLIPTGTSKKTITESINPRVDSVYSNGITNRWLSTLPLAERELILVHAKTIRVKRIEEWMSDDRRYQATFPIKQLYISGIPNMVPLMVVDLLLRGFGPLYVTGATFFLGPVPYRSGQRRIHSAGSVTTDRFGSRGAEFERCRAISGHDQIMNLAIIRNLFLEGLVTGDQGFTASLSMEIDDYLRQLDKTYGEPRR